MKISLKRKAKEVDYVGRLAAKTFAECVAAFRSSRCPPLLHASSLFSPQPLPPCHHHQPPPLPLPRRERHGLQRLPNARGLTLESLQQSRFLKPLLIEERSGLGLVIPEGASVPMVVQILG